MSGILFSSSLLATAPSARVASSISSLAAPRWASARDRTEVIRARPVMRSSSGSSRPRVFPSAQMVPQSKRIACVVLTEEERDPSICPLSPEEHFDPHAYFTCRPRPRTRPGNLDRLLPPSRRGTSCVAEQQLRHFSALNRIRHYTEWQSRDVRAVAPAGTHQFASYRRGRPVITNVF